MICGAPSLSAMCLHSGSSARCLAAAYVSIRQHTSAYVSIRQAYTSIRRNACTLGIEVPSSAFCVSSCTFVPSNASKLGTIEPSSRTPARQYLYFCTSNASKLGTVEPSSRTPARLGTADCSSSTYRWQGCRPRVR
jgi:hypothetical protein